MSIRTKQVCASVLGAIALYVGLWAAFWPRRFDDAFPGLGRHWVMPLGPYDEHLVRDVGGLYLAMAVVSVWAAAAPRSGHFPMVGLGWLAFDIPHAVFHMRHLGVFGGADAAGNIVTLWGLLVPAALLLVPEPRPT